MRRKFRLCAQRSNGLPQAQRHLCLLARKGHAVIKADSLAHAHALCGRVQAHRHKGKVAARGAVVCLFQMQKALVYRTYLGRAAGVIYIRAEDDVLAPFQRLLGKAPHPRTMPLTAPETSFAHTKASGPGMPNRFVKV